MTMRPFQQHVAKYLTIPAPLSLTTLRYLRMWSLQHEVGLNPLVVRKLAGYKTNNLMGNLTNAEFTKLLEEPKPYRIDFKHDTF